MPYQVLIADDEEIIRQGMPYLLDWTALDCTMVAQVANGQEAIRYIENHPSGVDIIVSDIRMPIVDGLSVARYVAQSNLPIQVIILTAYADFSYAQEAIQYSVTDFILKSDIAEGLPTAVNKAKELLFKKRQEHKRVLDAEYIFKKSKRTQMENLLRGSLQGTVPPILPEALRASCRYYLAVYEISQCRQVSRNTDAPMMVETNIITVALKDYETVTITLSPTQYCSLIFFDHPQQTIHGLLKGFHDIISILEGYAQTTVFVGVSLQHTSLTSLSAAYQQAIGALNDSVIHHNKVNLYSKAALRPSSDSSKLPHIQQFITSFIDTLKSDHPDEILPMLEQYHSDFLAGGGALEAFKLNILLIYTTLTSDVGQMDVHDQWENLHADEVFYQAVESSRTFRGVYNSLHRFISLYLEILKESKGLQNNLIRQVSSYIHKNYNQNINLQTIADTFMVSSGYLSRLYRKETGVSLITALNTRRMEVAKRLLADPTNKVFEVAKIVGIEDPTYFTHLFTKYTGMNPTSYRNQ